MGRVMSSPRALTAEYMRGYIVHRVTVMISGFSGLIGGGARHIPPRGALQQLKIVFGSFKIVTWTLNQVVNFGLERLQLTAN